MLSHTMKPIGLTNGSALPRRTDRIVVMGVLNVTPDSFSDGGRWNNVDDAISRGVLMRDEGADLVDVGGESTRPGAQRVDARTEIERVVPVIEQLHHHGVPTSIDTTRAEVADAALQAGASIVNDVSGGLADPAMAAVVRAARCPWVLMHWRGHSDVMTSLAHYDDVVRDVRAELDQRVEAALAAGIDVAQLVIDPGLGFAKTAEHNWALLARLDTFVTSGIPVLVAASRKSFLGVLLGDATGPRPVSEREAATVAITAQAAASGVWGVRVHEVRPNVDAAYAAAAISRATVQSTCVEEKSMP